MRLFRSGPELPPGVRSRVRGKPLAAAEAGSGAWLVGTRDALQAVDADGSALTLLWEQVHRADWDVESSTLQVEQVEDYGRPLSAYSFVLGEPGALLELVRERVTASVVLQRRTVLERRRGFSVIGRRAPAGGGEVSWAFEFDEGVDPDDPDVTARAEAALRDARESLGL
jgi:hypothetical protein